MPEPLPTAPTAPATPPAAPPAPAADPTAEMQRRISALKAENERFRAEEEQARRAAMTQQEQLAETRAEIRRLETENLRARIARESGLDDTLSARLIGDTEADLRRDAEELKKMLANTQRAHGGTPPHQPGKRVFKTSELNDHRFFRENREAIMEAYRENRIVRG